MEITIIPVLKDNYSYVLRDEKHNLTAIIDPSEAEPILKFIQTKNWQLNYILNTHHHFDHTGGNLELKAATDCQVIGSFYDKDRIPGIDQSFSDGEKFVFGESEAEIIFIPGHTLGHIAYYFKDAQALFCGDTLFSLGCGRLFEGTPEQMVVSLNRLASLPLDTKIYSGHEYTESNGNFALTIEPGNPLLQNKLRVVKDLRAKNISTIPSTLKEELECNPFLRTDSLEIQENIGLTGESQVTIFTKIRQLKNGFTNP
jgi:hydroxyacylglutathione hydrolase